LVEKYENGISFSKIKMAAVTILDSGYLLVFDIIDVLSFKVATFLPNLLKCGKKGNNNTSLAKFKMSAAACWILATRRFSMP